MTDFDNRILLTKFGFEYLVSNVTTDDIIGFFLNKQTVKTQYHRPIHTLYAYASTVPSVFKVPLFNGKSYVFLFSHHFPPSC